jgi:hypothetical protein
MPMVQVVKKIACLPVGGDCATASGYAKSATGFKTATQNPAFCYSITVTNTGNVGLNSITVVDDVLGDLSAAFADTLPVGGSETKYFSAAHASTTMNVVMVNGQGDFATGPVMSSDDANAVVNEASITCVKRVSSPDDKDGNSGDSHVSLLADGNVHQVTYTLQVTAGNAPLMNVTISDPKLIGDCDLPGPFALAANQSTNLTLCTVGILCEGAGDDTNTVTVTAKVATNITGTCGLDEEGQPITVEHDCSAVVTCIACPTVEVNKATVCEGASAQLCAAVTGGSAPFTYQWSNGATSQCISVSSGGQYCVTVTDANGCVVGPICGTLTVNPVPTCNITGDGQICAGSSTEFCGPAGMASYTWSGPGNFSASTQCITVSVAGTYNLTIVSEVGCTNSCSKDLTLDQAPECSITGPSAICAGGSAQFCGPDNMVSYAWSGPGDFSASTQCITISVAGTYTLTIVSEAGCTNTCNRTLTVNPQPSCSISGPDLVCTDSKSNVYTVSVSPSSASIAWSITGNGSIVGSTSGNMVLVNAGAAGQFVLTVDVVQNGCISSCVKTVEVAALPACEINGVNSICPEGSTEFCAVEGMSSYAWSGPSGFTSAERCITISAPGEYTVTITDANGCQSSCSRTLALKPVPNCTIEGATPVCDGATNTYTVASNLSGATFEWSISGNGTILDATDGAAVAVVASGVGSYTLNVTVTKDECSSYCRLTVEVKDCTPEPAGCRVTGGGVSKSTCPTVKISTHGGQVGAPHSVETPFTPDAECIKGEWQHVRHIKGGLKGNFHARSFDSLMCACLPCDYVDVPSQFGSCFLADRTYVAENPTQAGRHHELCNPDDPKNGCGPEPRPAPANKICFSGVGDYTETKGNRAPRSVVFRVDIEDRSEPGGAFPKGQKPPPDRYRIRIWFLNGQEAIEGSAANLALREAVACKDPLTEVVSARMTDVDDGGDLYKGNHQLHPVTGSQCP